MRALQSVTATGEETIICEPAGMQRCTSDAETALLTSSRSVAPSTPPAASSLLGPKDLPPDARLVAPDAHDLPLFGPQG